MTSGSRSGSQPFGVYSPATLPLLLPHWLDSRAVLTALTPGVDVTPKCPNCQALLAPTDALCPTCRIDLRTPEAAELFQLDAYFAGGLARRQQLLDVLFARRDAPTPPAPMQPAPPMPPPGWVPAPPRTQPVPPAPSARTEPLWPTAPPLTEGSPLPRPRAHVSAQHVLLAIGAVLVLSASAVFVAAIWDTIGLTGQALVMGGLTVAAGAATAASARRTLSATAEAFAVITLGLALVDLVAIRHYNLADAASLSSSWYVGLSLAVLGAVGLALHNTASGLRVALPAAAFAFIWTPWAPLLHYGDDQVDRVAYLALAVAFLDLVVAVAFASRGLGEGRRSPQRVAVLIAGTVTACACLVHATASLTEFLGVHGPASRYGVWIALWGMPVALLALGRLRPVPTVASLTGKIWIGGLVLLPIVDLPLPGYIALTAIVLTGNGWTIRSGRDRPILNAALTATNILLAVIATALAVASTDTVRHGIHDQRANAPAALATAVIGIAIVHALVGAYRRLQQPDAHAWASGAIAPFGLLVLNLGHADGFGGAAVGAVIAAITYIAIASIRLRREPAESSEFEVLTLGIATGFLTVSLGCAANAGANWAAAICYAAGIAIVAYATSPGRMRAAYLGSAVISAGTATLLQAHDVSVIEIVTVPAAAMLAVIGWLEWRRNRAAPTFLTVGPWLSVLVLPTTWQGLGDGQTWRAVAAVAIGAVAVIAGFARNGQAPVLIGGFVLLVMAITQGGPYLAYVPSWVLLYGGGAALLACGIMWERAIALGRRTARYLIQMQ